MSEHSRLVVACLVAILAATPLFAQTRPDNGDREISPIQGDLYRVRDGARHTILMVTPDGIILGDPLSLETARWLEAELAVRFPERPVRYVLHSHHHFDRAEGAAVFNTAEVIAHRDFSSSLSAALRSWPDFYGIDDRDRNGVLDPQEIGDSPRDALIRAKDRNGDAQVTPDELYRRVLLPNTTYDSRRTIVLGGRTVELVHTPSPHAPDMTALYFPMERLVFVVDPPPVIGSRFSVDADEWRDVSEWLDTIRQLDFDLGLTSENDTFSAASIQVRSRYVADLMTGVVAARVAGRPLEQTQATPFLEKYESEAFWADRSTHIASAYSSVRLLHWGVSVAAVGNYAPPPSTFCTGFSSCTNDVRVVPRATVGISVSGARLGVTVELAAGDQSWHVRTSPFLDEEFAARQSRGSVLFRYQPVRRVYSLAFVGGLSATVTDRKGMAQRKQTFAESGGRRPFSARTQTGALTVGVDLMRRVAGAIELVIPLRLTHGFREARSDPAPRTDLHMGVGLTYRVTRGFVRR